MSTVNATHDLETQGPLSQRKIHQKIIRHRYGGKTQINAALLRLGLVAHGKACPVVERAKKQVAEEGENALRFVSGSVTAAYSKWN